MSRVLLSEAYEVTGHGGACLPVLERKQRGVCWEVRKVKRLDKGEIREGIGGGRKKWYNMGIK